MSMRAGGDSNRRLDIEIGTQHIGRAVEQQAGTQFNFLVGPFFNRDNGLEMENVLSNIKPSLIKYGIEINSYLTEQCWYQ